MKTLDQLPALDASIQKWENWVYRGEFKLACPLCELHKDSDGDIHCKCCEITKMTDEYGCYGTSFYETAFNEARLSGISYAPNRYDNTMLSELYEIRRQYIASAHGEE